MSSVLVTAGEDSVLHSPFVSRGAGYGGSNIGDGLKPAKKDRR
ncbi:hypothetical protein [Novosphingobium sp. AP12]|nr:hypothetical protein [Novosphingobium sp. AP12]